MSVAEATEVAIKAATHLTEADEGALAALRVLARTIDRSDALHDAYMAWFDDREMKRPDRPLQLDNVSIPSYLKYCEALGLTSVSRKTFDNKTKPAAAPAPVSKIAQRRRASIRSA